MKRVTVADAPAVLNTNDKAFWAIGWNDCAEAAEAAVKQARVDALDEAKKAVDGETLTDPQDNSDDAYNNAVYDCLQRRLPRWHRSVQLQSPHGARQVRSR